MKKENPLPEAFADIIGIQSSQYMIQNIATELYWDLKGYHLDAKDSAGDPIILYSPDAKDKRDEGLDRIIQILTDAYDTEHVMFQPQHSSLIVAADDKSGNLVLKKQDLKDDSIFFTMNPVDDRGDTYFIRMKDSDLYLTRKKEGNNSLIVLREPVLDESQMWYFKTMRASEVAQPDTGYYTISTVADTKSWDFGGAYPALSNTELQIWDNERGTTWPADRIIAIVTEYSDRLSYMTPMSHRSTMFSAYANKGLKLESRTRSLNQQWVFEYAGIPRGY